MDVMRLFLQISQIATPLLQVIAPYLAQILRGLGKIGSRLINLFAIFIMVSQFQVIIVVLGSKGRWFQLIACQIGP